MGHYLMQLLKCHCPFQLKPCRFKKINKIAALSLISCNSVLLFNQSSNYIVQAYCKVKSIGLTLRFHDYMELMYLIHGKRCNQIICLPDSSAASCKKVEGKRHELPGMLRFWFILFICPRGSGCGIKFRKWL